MYNLNLQHVCDNSVNHPPLKPEPRRTMAFPLTGQSFIVKPFDGPQTLRPGKPGNVLPFLVAFQYLYRHGARKLLINATMFLDQPHATLCIYH